MAGSPFFTSTQYLTHFLRATGPQQLHSPFVFALHQELIKPASNFRLPEVESLRKKLYSNHNLIDVIDFRKKSSQRKTVSSIAKASLSKPKFSAFLRLLANYLDVVVILETGTSFGLNALYLASSKARKVVTIEASPIISSIAEENFLALNKAHIELINATLADSFIATLVKYQPDMIFLDANHRGSATLGYLDDILKQVRNVKCIVLHDIYWSKDMKKMWAQVVEDDRFDLTIDIFYAGLIFPKRDMPKQHFTLRF